MFVYQLFVMVDRPLARAFSHVAAGCWRGRGSESRAAGEGLPREAASPPRKAPASFREVMVSPQDGATKKANPSWKGSP